MNSADEAWLKLLLVALFGLLLFSRYKYPNASKRAETAVLVGTTILFFSICNFLVSPNTQATRTVQEVRQNQRNPLGPDTKEEAGKSKR